MSRVNNKFYVGYYDASVLHVTVQLSVTLSSRIATFWSQLVMLRFLVPKQVTVIHDIELCA